jgi:hypothetical protein
MKTKTPKKEKFPTRRVAFKPMKAQGYKPSKVTYPHRQQRKLNGLRAEYENDQFVTGDGVVWNNAVVAHILDPLNLELKRLGWQGVRLDGEFYKHGWSLQRINKFIGVKNHHARPETLEIGFRVFDLNMHGDFETVREPALDGVIRHLRKNRKLNVRKVKTVPIKNQAESDAFYDDSIRKRYEGTILRLARTPKGDSPKFRAKGLSDLSKRDWEQIDTGYLEGKRPHWVLKRKEKFDAEFKIIAMCEGKVTDKGGKHVGRMGAVICVTKDNKQFHVGSGFSDKQRQKYWDERKDKKKTILGKMLRVKFGRLSDTGIPVEPRAFDGCIRDYA